MLHHLHARLTYANVMATVAVFIALGGSSYAALKVTGRDVKNASLTGLDVKDNSLTGKDVKGLKSADVSDHSLLAKDFKDGQLPAGVPGQQGPAGQTGETGPQGPPGPTAGTATGNYADAPANPSVVFQHSTIHMSSPGRIFVIASIRSAAASCTFTTTTTGPSGNCTLTLGLYVDGQPVPKSAFAFGNSGASSGTSFNTNIQASDFDRSLFGVSAPVPAGDHEVQLGAKLDPHPNNADTTGSQGPNAPSAVGIVGGIALGT